MSLRVDPADSANVIHYARILARSGHLKEAIEQYQAAIELSPTIDHAEFADVLARTGEFDRAAAELQQGYILRGEPDIAAEFKRQYPQAGYPEAAASAQRTYLLRTLKKLNERRVNGEYVSPSAYVRVYAGLQRHDETLHWLDQAYHEHSTIMLQLRTEQFDFIRHDPHFDSIYQSIPFYR